MKSGAFVLALAMVLFSVAVSQADAPIIGEDKVTYRVSLENSGDLYQIAKAHNIYESGECKKIERRDAPDGTWMEFDVTYDPLTFIASSYTYKEYDGKHTYTTKAVINDSTTEFTITDETGKTWNRSLKRKEGAPPLFDPVYTYYFGSMLGKGVSSGTIQMIITHDNGFDDYLMDWKVLGTETVDVGSGKWEADHILMTLHNPVLRHLAPANDFWYAQEGLRPLVRLRTKRTLTGPYLVSEATEYTRIK